MKLLNKVTPYSIKRAVPVIGMAMATLFGGCKKAEPEIVPTPQFKRTILWGNSQGSIKKMTPRVGATADSIEVKKVTMQYDDGDLGGALSTSEVLNDCIMVLVNSAKPENRYKFEHRGNIYRPGMNDRDPERYARHQADSAELVRMGYTIEKPIYATIAYPGR